VGSCEHGNEHSAHIKVKCFLTAEQLLASRGGLCSVELFMCVKFSGDKRITFLMYLRTTASRLRGDPDKNLCLQASVVRYHVHENGNTTASILCLPVTFL
jgi:hypothetical protein